MRKTLTTIAIALSGLLSSVHAQQDPQFTQFMHCKLAYNPAYAGTSDAICFNALYRQQWVSFPGAPRTGLIAFDMPIQPTFGVGLTIMNDQLGFDNTTSARLAFAFHRVYTLNSGKDIKFSLGLDGGILQKKINGTWVAPQTLQDPSIPSNAGTGGTGSPALNKLAPDFGLGLYVTIPNTMYVGLSATHLVAQDLAGAKQASISSTQQGYALNFKMSRHYYVIAGYHFQISDGNSELIPNIKVKSDATITQLDVNLTYMIARTFWLGATYRVQDAIAPMLGYQRSGLKIGYSFDVTTSKLKGYTYGTHEIMLSYCINKVKPLKKDSHGNVRFLED